MQVRIIVFTVDGEAYAGKKGSATQEELDSLCAYLQGIKTTNYLALYVSDNETIYFNPDKVVGVKVEAWEN